MNDVKLWFGVDYYPEHWPVERRVLDADIISGAGFNVVRLAEFAWCRLEPSPGKFNFQWLDDVIELLSAKGVKAILGTPTAAPPPWLVKIHPDILPVNFKGYRMPPVARRHYCPNNPNYIKASERIVEAMAEHYKDNPNVIGYQIDNELSLGDEYCYCEQCITLFRNWLKGKYGSISELNKAYGTIFWSHEYGDWDEIHPPTPPFDECNRGLSLDWFRFRSESFVNFLKIQVRILKSVSPNKRVTTNLMGLFPGIDYYNLSRNLDFPSWDCYPKFSSPYYDPAWISLLHDATRCMGVGNFWVMELQAGPTDGYAGNPIGVTPDPGELRKWLYQSIAHGAEGAVYFRYRTVCFGKEQYWHGILNHDGEVNRRYLEVKKAGEELRKIGEVLVDAEYRSDVGLIFSYDSLWATLVENRYYSTSYHEQVLNAYKGFWSRGVNIDVVPPDRDFTKYRILLAPFLYLTSKNLIERLKNYVEDGGLLIATARTSVKDEFNRVYSNGLPGELEDLFGLRVTDYTSIPPGREAKISTQYGLITASGWLEELTVKSAQVLGLHDYEWLKGKPGLTVNHYGKGYAVYVGCFLTQDASKLMADKIVERGLVKPPVELRGEPVELVSKEGRDYRLLFLINHDPRSKTVELDFGGVLDVKSILRDLHVEGKTVKLTLNPHDVEILYFED